MKPQTAEAIKTWIAYDLPPSEKESLSPAHLEALMHRIDDPPEPVKEPPKPPAAPKPAPTPPKPKVKAKAKAVTPKPTARKHK